MRKIINKLKRVKFYLFRARVNIYAKTHKYSTYIGIVSCNTWKSKVYEDVSIKYYLNRQGYGAEIISYEEENDYSKYKALIIKSIWGFQKNKEIFDKFLEQVSKNKIPLYNSVEIISNNYNKEKQFKLLDKYHIKHIDTVFIENDPNIAQKIKETWENKFNKYDKLVIKPVISESSEDTYIISLNDTGKNTITIKDVENKYQNIKYPLMLQPFIKEVKNGEYSVICFSNKLSHVIERCVSVFGEKPYIKYIKKETIDDKMLEIVNQICLIKEYKDNLYMRIDLVKTDEEYQVMEVELLDPQLFLNSITSNYYKKEAYQTFTKEIINRITKQTK